MDIQGFINSINWSAPSWDLFIIIIFVAGIFLYTLSLGKSSVAGSFLPPQEASALSPFITSIFINNQAQFFWIVSPLAAMLLFKK